MPTRLRLVIFDLDGVVYRGEQPVPGAVDLIGDLHANDVLVRFATNNSTATRDEYVERLGGMGIRTSTREVVTSTSATVEHLERHHPDVRRVLALGEAGLRRELAAAGYEVLAAQDAAPDGYQGEILGTAYDAVVCGLDRGVTYQRLAVAASAIRAGARFVATNADLRFPTPIGLLPGAGAIVAAIRAATGVDPLVIGKPQPAMFSTILEAAGVPVAEALVVGDNADSDIVAARRAGIASALVLTGVTDAASADGLEGDRRPSVMVAGPAALRDVLAGWLS
jgi:HAD superfamily hydrolase (TIGR01457 family)